MTKAPHKRVIVSVINDLLTDQRVHKTCMVFHEHGYEVLLVGRKKRDSIDLPARPYKTKRMKLLFEKGVPFYATFQIRLFFFLLFKKKTVLFSNDLDTLLPNYLNKKLSGATLIYDSHELFCEVPELVHTPTKKRIWEKVEKSIVPKLKYCITVNKSIANWFEEKYKVKFNVVRNIGNPPTITKIKSREELGLPTDKKIVLIQGSGINIQRGAEETVEAFQYINDAVLYIIGGGDVIEQLKQMVKELKLENKVFIKGKMPADELYHYTANVDLGLTIDKDNNINYHFSLPNKLFDFINASVPILSTPLPEIKAVIDAYNIGDFIQSHEPKHIASKIEEMLNSTNYNTWKENTKKAKLENNWQEEKKVLASIIQQIEK
ncbi:MAG: glycosyltransferase [Bacteroidetes bacterium]|nr:glycosyltransferase [Bacteroidota bacterium]